MRNYEKSIFKKIIPFMMAFLIIVGNINIGYAKGPSNKKAIVFVMDEVNIKEIKETSTPNIDRLLEHGAMGLMNIKSKGRLDKESAFLSLGMGVRTASSKDGGLSYNRLEDVILYPDGEESFKAENLYELYSGNKSKGQVVNVAIEDIKRTALDTTPNNEVGLLGKTLRENNLKVGVLGNSDLEEKSRAFTLMAIDENGLIPYGNVGSDLIEFDKDKIGGYRLNKEKALEDFINLKEKSDVIFFDYGDTARLEASSSLTSDEIKARSKHRTIEEADAFIGELIKNLDMDNTLFMIISPNPSRFMIGQGNTGLTPVILSEKTMENGLLTSSTTNRDGLVTNFDFGPTLLNFFNIKDKAQFIGEPMKVTKGSGDESLFLSKIQDESIYLRANRKFFHISYIVFSLLLFALYILRNFTSIKIFKKEGLKKVLNYMSLTLASTPLMMMTVSQVGYKYIVLDLMYIYILAFVFSYILKKIVKDDFLSLSIIGIITSISLILDVFIFKKYMIISPLGSDAIAGGRFYGIGNDYMGILLGSSLMALFSIFEKKKSSKKEMFIISLVSLSIITVALSPFFGANMGGTLSAIAIILLLFLIIFDFKFSFKKMILMGMLVVVLILGLASVDALFNPNPTHAGKAMIALFTGGGMDKLIEIISIKLRQVGWNLYYAPWRFVLFLEIISLIIMFVFKKEFLAYFKKEFPNLYKGFIITILGSIFIFMFNDTGTIAASLILLYAFIPIGRIIDIKK